MRNFALVILLAALPAFAAEIECAKRVSNERTEGGLIQTWPHLNVSVSYHECSSRGGSGYCKDGIELLAYDHQVCFHDVDVNVDCSTFESAGEVRVDCRNGVSLHFEMENGEGRIMCMEQGRVRKTWHVGACHSKA